MAKKGQYVVGRVDGEKLPSGFRRKRFHEEHNAKVYVTSLTAKHTPYPEGGYYVDGPKSPKRVTQKTQRERTGTALKALEKLPGQHTAPSCQYIDVRSKTRVDIIHHVYTGDSVNGFHCTCEAFHHGTRECDVLFICKHIDEVVFGKGA